MDLTETLEKTFMRGEDVPTINAKSKHKGKISTINCYLLHECGRATHSFSSALPQTETSSPNMCVDYFTIAAKRPSMILLIGIL